MGSRGIETGETVENSEEELDDVVAIEKENEVNTENLHDIDTKKCEC